MSERKEFGRHSLEAFELDPATLIMIYDGNVSKEEARSMSEWFSVRIEGRDSRFLVDLRKLGDLGPDARRELAAERTPPRTDRDYHVEIAFVGASLRTKILMSVILGAASLTSNVKMTTRYFNDWAEGERWAGLIEA
jgi:hypothetical protein